MSRPQGWGEEKFVLHKPCLHPDSVARRPPLEKGGQGGYPRVTTAWCAVPGRLSSAELSHRPNVLAMPFNPPFPGVLKCRFWTSSEFLPVSLRVFPPCEGGVRGGGPGGTRRQVRGFGSAGSAELRRRPRLLVMPCPPPLPPSSQGGERNRSLAPAFNRAQQKRGSRNGPLSTFNRVLSSPLPPFSRGDVSMARNKNTRLESTLRAR